MGNTQTTIQPAQFLMAVGYSDSLSDSALPNKAELSKRFLKMGGGAESFEFNEHNDTIQQTGMSAKDLRMGNSLLSALQDGVGEVQAKKGDVQKHMLKNLDAARRTMAEKGFDLTFVAGGERSRDMELETYNLQSVKQVSDSMVQTLTTGFSLSSGIAQALVYGKMAEFLDGLNVPAMRGTEKRSFLFRDFAVQFFQYDEKLQCTSINSYVFQFESEDRSQRGWVGSSSQCKMKLICKKMTFLITAKESSANESSSCLCFSSYYRILSGLLSSAKKL